MIYRILTPNQTFTGDRAGVSIIAGHGVTSSDVAAEECRKMGYAVVEAPELVLPTLPTLTKPLAPPAATSTESEPDSLTLTKKARREKKAA